MWDWQGALSVTCLAVVCAAFGVIIAVLDKLRLQQFKWLFQSGSSIKKSMESQHWCMLCHVMFYSHRCLTSLYYYLCEPHRRLWYWEYTYMFSQTSMKVFWLHACVPLTITKQKWQNHHHLWDFQTYISFGSSVQLHAVTSSGCFAPLSLIIRDLRLTPHTAATGHPGRDTLS